LRGGAFRRWGDKHTNISEVSAGKRRGEETRVLKRTARFTGGARLTMHHKYAGMRNSPLIIPKTEGPRRTLGVGGLSNGCYTEGRA